MYTYKKQEKCKSDHIYYTYKLISFFSYKIPIEKIMYDAYRQKL